VASHHRPGAVTDWRVVDDENLYGLMALFGDGGEGAFEVARSLTRADGDGGRRGLRIAKDAVVE
jgi:hypothetical protein